MNEVKITDFIQVAFLAWLNMFEIEACTCSWWIVFVIQGLPGQKGERSAKGDSGLPVCLGLQIGFSLPISYLVK